MRPCLGPAGPGYANVLKSMSSFRDSQGRQKKMHRLDVGLKPEDSEMRLARINTIIIRELHPKSGCRL